MDVRQSGRENGGAVHTPPSIVMVDFSRASPVCSARRPMAAAQTFASFHLPVLKNTTDSAVPSTQPIGYDQHTPA